ncbi:MAG TPA: cation transporter [Candidatus Latescibacteria bacterium]|nr:cation transporter [Candidatus Latescibacterota bacterium]HOF61731.1 cation transporter [Candidatus Latescibacterota bacterium]HOS64379.1 cation transporter [Candidatus Latescibacterota bacterium]HPK75280.1 cation transporter [Candidatus Latescibacterota bacterium]
MAICTMNIEGMTCQHCVKAVTSVLSKVAGVERATVSLEKKQATLEVDEATFDLEAARKAVIDEGYVPR